ncbi:GUN4 domain-containing protein [Limnothrix sp. FACHB-881]|uniref:serine/threonine-protein kinase n=1 Tax=Limnothrix sp. FACHB-881 TaxID=2692819 RepID=UPI001689DD8C|nr:serine/threonine-protein kinase [Limnothrix sp. FACHB-881]MBD2636689.1 GUN4 domain-containing protein [Limnothrix sp. FACHB-881]
MSYCLNSRCTAPENDDHAANCAACGRPLRLGNRYLPQSPIGRGGFGYTFLAKDLTQPDRPPCVIKQLVGSFAQDPKARRLFTSEARLLADLGSHPQIPQFLDFVEADQTIYLMQEWIEGPTLNREALGGPWSARKVEALLRDVLPILQFVHDRGVVHRDIKPSNFIRRLSDRRMVLIDFGIAKVIDPYWWDKTGTVIGSPEYIAPEQLAGKALPASDLYSLGVTCLRLLTGVSPFMLRDSTSDAWVWRDFLPPRVTIPPRLGTVLDRAVTRATGQRYATAADMLAALDRSPQPAPTPEKQRARVDRPAASPNDQPTITTFPLRRPSNEVPTQTGLGSSNQPPFRPLPSLSAPQPPWLNRLLPSRLIKTPLCDRGVVVSVAGLDYHPLERLLATGEWQQADELSRQLLCQQLDGRRRFVQVGDIPRLSRPDLLAIDLLWMHYSHGRFGLMIQSRLILQSRDYNQFCQTVGWPGSRSDTRDETFQFRADAPIGHLPSRNWVGGPRWWNHAQALADYLIR